MTHLLNFICKCDYIIPIKFTECPLCGEGNPYWNKDRWHRTYYQRHLEEMRKKGREYYWERKKLLTVFLKKKSSKICVEK